MKQVYKNIILSHNLFRGCSEKDIKKIIIDGGKPLSFRSGDIMETDFRSVGILLSGRGAIYSSDKSRHTLLRFISPGDAVGVAGLFAAKAPETQIIACGDGKSEMFFIGREAFEQLMNEESDGQFRTNLIKFLSDRVTFLNSRIDCVTGGSAERRLALFIKNSPVDSSGCVLLGMSMTALAHALDIGRASLYRSFDSLQNNGIIERDGNCVKILSRDSLDNY
jgi:CRP-like cAMP-binding protein